MEQKPKLIINNFLSLETGRLTSLSLKRDLSLGGNKPKKVYKPNLNVIRNKNKGKIQTNNKNHYQQDNKHNHRTLGARTNNMHRYIQSNSVFSEGAGELKKPKIYSDRYLNGGYRDPINITMPKIIKTQWEVNAKEENSVIDELLGEDEDDSSSENEGEYSPVILPLGHNKASFMKIFGVKKEEVDDLEIKEEVPKPKITNYNNVRNHNLVINHQIPLSFQNKKLYDDDRPCISLFRMPDSLPGKGFVDDSDNVTDFNLNQMIEGKIGRVLVRRSGAVEVHIGKIKYIADAVESNPFKEDLMSVTRDVKNCNRGADMANLGNIDEKYILSPSWKGIFDSRDIKKK